MMLSKQEVHYHANSTKLDLDNFYYDETLKNVDGKLNGTVYGHRTDPHLNDRVFRIHIIRKYLRIQSLKRFR